MNRVFSKFLASTALALILPGTAFSEVSAGQIWDSWKGYAETFGQQVTVGSQQESGGTLKLSNVTFSAKFPEGGVSSTLEFIEFQERGDGTVAITMSNEIPLTMAGKPKDGEEGEDVNIVMSLRQSGTSIIASGDAETITYDYLSASIDLSVDKFIVDGENVAPVVNFSINDIDGKYTSTTGDLNSIASEMIAAGLTFDMSFTDPKDGGSVKMSGKVNNWKSNSKLVYPQGVTMEDPSKIFESGFDIQGGLVGGNSSYTMSFKDGSDDFAASGTSSGSSLDFAMVDGGIKYGGTTTNTQYRLTSSQIPFPEITFGMAETGFELEMPLSQTDEPADFGLLVKIVGLEVSDAIWGMLDGGGILPHDPATLIFDVGGKAQWLINLMDPDAMKGFSGDMPGELYNLDVNDVTLSMVGAEAKATGGFTFDNTDLKTFDGLPAPTGTIDIELSGVNALLDNLIAMGLLPQDQAMGARMMIGLFARPAGGDDQWTSELEVKGDGSVFANGQQLK